MNAPNTTLWVMAEVVCCFIGTAVGVDLFVRWAAGRVLDVPNPRSLHVRPTPRGAGIVIVVIVVAGVIAARMLGVSAFPPIGAVAAGLIIAVVSAVDDLRPLSSRLRLLVQVMCATIAVGAVGAGYLGVPVAIAAGLAVVWVVGLTNAFNFMDGIDGIAGAQAVVTGAAVAAAAAFVDLRTELVAGTAVAAASAGFLLHNWSPARVFMGDVGSAFLGFVFAVLALLVARVSVPLSTVVAASLWPFIFDTSLTLARRAVRRENLFVAHRSHLYQRLVITGWSHAQVTLLYGGAALCGAASTFAWATRRASSPILLLIPVMALSLWGLVAWRESMRAKSTGRVLTP